MTFTDAWPGVPTAGVDVTGRGESKRQLTAVAPDASIVAVVIVRSVAGQTTKAFAGELPAFRAQQGAES